MEFAALPSSGPEGCLRIVQAFSSRKHNKQSQHREVAVRLYCLLSCIKMTCLQKHPKERQKRGRHGKPEISHPAKQLPCQS